MTISESVTTAGLVETFVDVRGLTEELAAPLSAEDQCIQSMPDTSPTKWHRAHTTWFFETFVLSEVEDYSTINSSYGYLFNSYYEQVGPQFPRPQRGLLSRPSVAEVGDYRTHVDQAMVRCLDGGVSAEQANLVTLGLHHEQQHQELLLMDIKHVLSCNPLQPEYDPDLVAPIVQVSPLGWVGHDGGAVAVGHDGAGFCYDNELPQHDQLLVAFELADRLVTAGEWLEFIDAGGYSTPELWLSDGWATVQQQGWVAPLYWDQVDGEWTVFTLRGRRPLDPALPVCHVSYYEADAFARWAGARLPTETEWETLARSVAPVEVNDVSRRCLHPQSPPVGAGLRQMFGDVWEWTASPYTPYPGFSPAAGAVGEYNGKFMVNQQVLRGGSCLTPPDHVRSSYRNFFAPHTRWHCSGVRLARDRP